MAEYPEEFLAELRVPAEMEREYEIQKHRENMWGAFQVEGALLTIILVTITCITAFDATVVTRGSDSIPHVSLIQPRALLLFLPTALVVLLTAMASRWEWPCGPVGLLAWPACLRSNKRWEAMLVTPREVFLRQAERGEVTRELVDALVRFMEKQYSSTEAEYKSIMGMCEKGLNALQTARLDGESVAGIVTALKKHGREARDSMEILRSKWSAFTCDKAALYRELSAVDEVEAVLKAMSISDETGYLLEQARPKLESFVALCASMRGFLSEASSDASCARQAAEELVRA